MKSEEIISIIERLNSGEVGDDIFICPISEKVVYAKVWENEIISSTKFEPRLPYDFYFFKAESDKFIGAVLDRKNDLHWVVVPEYRGKGYLKKALFEAVIPHLAIEKTEQRITVDTRNLDDAISAASEKVALAVGFQRVEEVNGKVEFVLNLEGKDTLRQLKLTRLNRDRKEVVQSRIKVAFDNLVRAKIELEFGYGYVDEVEGLEYLNDDLRSLIFRLNARFLDEHFDEKAN
jgi:RimJ/RimL family protein N-acetyltransferase